MGAFDHLIPQRQGAQPAPQDAPAAAEGGAAPASPLYDIMRSAGTGLRTGVEMIPAMAGDMGRLIERGSEAIARPIFGDEQVDKVKAAREKTGGSNEVDRFFRQTLPTLPDVQAATDEVIGEHYKPETTAGKYAKTVGEFVPMAAAGGGTTMSGLGRAVLGQGVVPGVASEAAGQATEGTAAEPWARAAGGLAGGVAGGLATLERTPRNLKQGQRQDVLDASNRQGVHLPSYAMPDAPVANQVASRVVDIPFLGGPVRAASERAARDMGARTNELARQIGNPDMTTATFEAHDALRSFQTTASRAFKQQLYDDVDSLITNPTMTTPLSNTRGTVAAIRNEGNLSTVNSSDTALALVREATRRPLGLTYEGLKQLRTDIGARISGKITPEPGTNQPALKRLYASLTDDLEQAVYRSGGQPALDAWRNANQMTRALEEVSAGVAKVVGRKGEVTPQNAMKTIISLATAEDATVRNRLGMIRMAMDEARPGAWEDTGAAILSFMGRNPKAAANEFSPQHFLTRFSKMSREGRALLFGNDVADALEDIATLARNHKDLTNPSKFGVPIGAGFGLGIGVAGLSNPFTVISGAVGANMMARILSRPATAQKMATWARAREGAVRGSAANAINAAKAFAEEVEAETGTDSGALLDALLDDIGGANGRND